jgi:hypothetical protein
MYRGMGMNFQGIRESLAALGFVGAIVFGVCLSGESGEGGFVPLALVLASIFGYVMVLAGMELAWVVLLAIWEQLRQM